MLVNLKSVSELSAMKTQMEGYWERLRIQSFYINCVFFRQLLAVIFQAFFFRWAGSDKRSTKLLFQSRFAASEGLCKVFFMWFFRDLLRNLIEISYHVLWCTAKKIRKNKPWCIRENGEIPTTWLMYQLKWWKTPRHRAETRGITIDGASGTRAVAWKSHKRPAGRLRFTGKMKQTVFLLKIRFGTCEKNQHWRYQMIFWNHFEASNHAPIVYLAWHDLILLPQTTSLNKCVIEAPFRVWKQDWKLQQIWNKV